MGPGPYGPGPGTYLGNHIFQTRYQPSRIPPIGQNKNLETQVEILTGELDLEFFNWSLTHMRDIWTLRPGLHSELPAESI